MDETNQNNQNNQSESTPETVVDTNINTMPTQTQTQTTTPEVGEKTNRPFYIALGIIVVAMIVAAWFQWGDKFMERTSSPSTAKSSEYPAVVATVNGINIKNENFTRSLEQTTSLAIQQGADVTDLVVGNQIKEQALAVLVNTELLLQAAKGSGVEITDQQVDEQLVNLETQFGSKEALTAQMTQLGMDQAKLRTDVSEQLSIDAYIKGVPLFQQAVVTDKEVEDTYASLVANGQELPSLTEIADQIKSSLLNQKQQQAIGVIIDELRAKAEIVIHI